MWLRDLGVATLDDVPDPELDRLAARGFDWIWMLGVWQTGPAGQEFSRRLFPDAAPADVCGSPFAITAYECHRALGGNAALARLRERLRLRGLRLMLDFVPNHTALDHPWLAEHRDYYVAGSDVDGLAFGRDPNFPGWPDTLQLNYGNPALQAAMRATLGEISQLCDGVRCDMAMLLLPEVFLRTWRIEAAPFWPRAIGEVRERHPDFVFLAEAYWDLEWTLQQQGFDFAYDKRLYDRLRDGRAAPLRAHLSAGLEYQGKLARFLENHDEPRAAATFPPPMDQAAALVAYCAPGLRFFYRGQFEGWREHASIHLCRRPAEADRRSSLDFYDFLLARLPQGDWRLLECRPAWDGNASCDQFIAYRWEQLLVIVNYGPDRGQCLVAVNLGEGSVCVDRWHHFTCERAGDRLYVDLPGWGFHFFEIRTLDVADFPHRGSE